MNIYQTDGHGISDWTNNKDVVHTSLYKDSNVEVFQATLNDKVEIYKTSNGKSNSFAKMQPLSLKTEIIDGKKEISLLRGDLWKDFYKDMGNVTKEGEIIYPNGKKPVRLISDIINSIVDENDIVMDFFSGSGTTAHSCLKVNSEYKKNIKFILIQIPEKIDYSVKQNKDNYQKYGFETICDLGEERIRRSANKIKEETNADIDYGFKHYSLKETNKSLLSKLEQFEPQLINETYDLYKEYGIDTIVETWKLRDGYKFTMPVEIINCNGYNAYKCEDSLYLIEPNIDIKNIKALLEHYSSDDLFVCNKIVLFGYSFKFNELEMIKNNIKQVKNFKNIDVKVYIRY